MSVLQIKRKFIEDAAVDKAKLEADAVDGTKLKLLSGHALRVVASNGQEKRLIEYSAQGKVLADGAEIAFKSEVEAEKAARETADTGLSGRLDIVEGPEAQVGSIKKALKDAKDYADSKVSAEQSARETADNSIKARLDTLESPETVEGSVAKAEADAKAYADTKVAQEKSERESADAAIVGRLNTIEGTGPGSIVKAEADAKAYADQAVANLIDSAPAVLDTLNELAAALGDDPNFAATVAGQVGQVSSDLAAEVSRAEGAEGAIRTGAGLESSGAYAAPVGSNYLGSATSLKDADSKLDAQLKAVAESVATLSGGGSGSLTATQSELDVTQSGAGLSASGQYVAPSHALLSGASSLASADEKLAQAIAAEAVSRAQEDASLQGAIEQEVADRETAITSARSFASGLVSAEQARAEAAESVLEGKIAAEKSRAEGVEANLQGELDATQAGAGLSASGAYEAPAVSNYLAQASSLKDADSKLDAAIKAEVVAREGAIAQEQSARETAVGLLQVKDAQLESAISVEKSRIDAILSASSADKDTFAEIVQFVNSIDATNDQEFGGYVLSNNARSAEMEGRLDTLEGAETLDGSVAFAVKAEKTRAMAAEGAIDAKVVQMSTTLALLVQDEADARSTEDEALSGRLDTLEARQGRKEKFTVTASHIANGIPLSYVPMAKTVVASIGRLMIHEGSGEDFQIVMESGVAVLKFEAGFKASEESVSEGDIVYVSYMA